MYTVCSDDTILRQLHFSEDEIAAIDTEDGWHRFPNLTIDEVDKPTEVVNLEIQKIVHSNLLPVWIVDQSFKESTVFTANITTELLFKKLIELDNSTCFLLKQQDVDNWFLFYITVEDSKIVVKCKRLIDLFDLELSEINNKINRLGKAQLGSSDKAIFIDDIDAYVNKSSLVNKENGKDKGSKSSVLDKVLSRRIVKKGTDNGSLINEIAAVPSSSKAPIDRSLERLIIGEMKIRNLDQSLNAKDQRELIEIVIRSIKFKYRNELYDKGNGGDYNSDSSYNSPTINLLDIDKIFESFDEIFKVLDA